MATRGKGTGKDFASQYGRRRSADTLKVFKPLTFDFHSQVLCVGQIPFLLDGAQLVLDHVEAGIFAFQFGAQARWDGMTFCRPQRAKINPRPPKSGLYVPDALGKEKALDPIDMGRSFVDEQIAFAMRLSGILFLNTENPDDGADMAFPAINRDKGVQQRQDVDPIRFYPPSPPVHLKACRIRDADVDPAAEQKPGQPEPIMPCFKARDQSITPEMAKLLQPSQQPSRIPS